MQGRRPEVFISATSTDLSTVRDLAKRALLRLGCFPIEQGEFPPDYRAVEEMLRAKIAACDAVVHVVGRCYGAEPAVATLPAGTARRSFTQLEAHLAKELGRPLYVFVCGEGFPFDDGPAESEDKRRLQDAYRREVLGASTIYEPIATREEFERRVGLLQTRLDALQRENRRIRRWATASVVGFGAILVTIGAAVWWGISTVGGTLDEGSEGVRAVAADVRHLSVALDERVVSAVRGAREANWPTLTRLPSYFQQRDRIGVENAGRVARGWRDAVRGGEAAIQELRRSLGSASEALPPEVLRESLAAVEARLESLAAEAADLDQLGAEWAANKESMEPYGPKWESLLARRGRFASRPAALVEDYEIAREDLGAILDAVLEPGEVDVFAVARSMEERRAARRLRRCMDQLAGSAVVPKAHQEDLATCIRDSARLAEEERWGEIIERAEPVVAKIRADALPRVRTEAMELTVLHVHQLGMIAKRFSGMQQDHGARLVGARAERLGLRFAGAAARWFVWKLPEHRAVVFRGELVPAVREVWGEVPVHAVEVAFRVALLATGFHPEGFANWSRPRTRAELVDWVAETERHAIAAELPLAILDAIRALHDAVPPPSVGTRVVGSDADQARLHTVVIAVVDAMQAHSETFAADGQRAPK